MFKVTTIKRDDGGFTVIPEGSIDSETYQILEKELASILDAETKIIVFDMQAVTYISSMGLGIIFKTKQTLEKNRGTLILINLQPQIQKVFEIVAELPTMSIFRNMKEADDYLGAIQKKEIQKNR